MTESISKIQERITQINSIKRQYNNLRPDAVKDFEKMYTNISKNEKKDSQKSENKSYHPHIKNEETSSKKINLTEKDKINEAVTSASKKYKISEDLINAVIKVESNFDKHGVSRAGAMGLMQIMPKTALELGVEKPFDIEENIFGGVKYLKKMLDKYNGDLDKALAAYNAGPKRVDAAGGIPDIEETKNYVSSIRNILLKKNKGF